MHGQRRGFLPNITLAHIAIARRLARRPEWRSGALDFLDIANDETPAEATFAGTPPKKLAWQIKLNKGPLMKFVKLRCE